MSFRLRVPTTARAVIVALTTLCPAAPLAAQQSMTPDAQPRLLVDGPRVTGGFGGLDVRATRLAGKTAVLSGLRGAWLVNHRLSIGGSAWWNVTPRINDVYRLPSGKRTGLGFGYGGVELGWSFAPAQVVHLTASTLVGAGASSFYELGRSNDDYERTRTDVFFVAEPSLGLEFNVSRHVRLVASGSYRFTAGAQLESLDNKSFQGVGGGLTLKLGSF